MNHNEPSRIQQEGRLVEKPSESEGSTRELEEGASGTGGEAKGGKVNTYEIINPSDAVTFKARDLTVARTVCFLLGNGSYGLEDEKGESVCPMFLFGGYEKWAKDNDYDLDSVIENQKEAIAEAMDTVIYCKIGHRKNAEKFISDNGISRHEYNDQRRTSTNDIGGRAEGWAKRLREKQEETAE